MKHTLPIIPTCRTWLSPAQNPKDACTSIMAGRNTSADGSVITFHNMTPFKKHISILLLALSCMAAWAEEVTYRIESFDKDKQDFVMKAFGLQPSGSTTTFWNDYGATTGNRYNQIPRGREATFLLQGWDGCTLRAITLSMCSNTSSGSLSLIICDGMGEIYRQRTCDYADQEWFGMWVNKDLGIYPDITRTLTEQRPIQGDVTITVKGGTQEGSVYLKSLTLDYEGAAQTESPMGWFFEKVEAKGKLAQGDIIMLYRSGDAASDIDGMETSHYLDAIGISSTTDVNEPDVELFTLSHDDSGSHWHMTDQHGRKLGATKAQELAWDAGVVTWDITPGYNGATIASTNTKYGTLRYNAPSESYPRFWNYTSKTLPLPYIYRRTRQHTPIVSTSMTLPWQERTVQLGTQDTLVVKPTLLPATVTDTRLGWQSSNTDVATVRSGIVELHSVGTATLTATSLDGGSSASMLLVVTDNADAIGTPVATQKEAVRKVIRKGKVSISTPRGKFDADGRRTTDRNM